MEWKVWQIMRNSREVEATNDSMLVKIEDAAIREDELTKRLKKAHDEFKENGGLTESRRLNELERERNHEVSIVFYPALFCVINNKSL